jgi:hypothetical protein
VAIDLGELVRRELEPVQRSHVVRDLLGTAGPDQDRCHPGIPKDQAMAI